MGCGCAKKAARIRRSSTSKRANKNTIVRKRRVNRLISVPGSVHKKKVVKKTKG